MAEPDPDKTSRQMAEMTSAIQLPVISPNILPGAGVGEQAANSEGEPDWVEASERLLEKMGSQRL